MATCAHCGAGEFQSFPYICKYCEQVHCSDHRMPEQHDCPALDADGRPVPALTVDSEPVSSGPAPMDPDEVSLRPPRQADGGGEVERPSGETSASERRQDYSDPPSRQRDAGFDQFSRFHQRARWTLLDLFRYAGLGMALLGAYLLFEPFLRIMLPMALPAVPAGPVPFFTQTAVGNLLLMVAGWVTIWRTV